MRAFIFSMDAFVAFTLALVAAYSLVFFSSVPSGYYATLAQAHTLSGDTLEALHLTPCTLSVPGCPGNQEDASVLEYIVLRDGSADTAKSFLDPLVPPALGYRLEARRSGEGWATLYDSNRDPDRPRNAYKLSVSSFSLLFQYSGPRETPRNPYSYITCNGGATACNVPQSTYEVPDAQLVLVKLTVYA